MPYRTNSSQSNGTDAQHTSVDKNDPNLDPAAQKLLQSMDEPVQEEVIMDADGQVQTGGSETADGQVQQDLLQTEESLFVDDRSVAVELEAGIVVHSYEFINTMADATELLFSMRTRRELCEGVPSRHPFKAVTFLISLRDKTELDLWVDGYGAWGNRSMRKKFYRRHENNTLTPVQEPEGFDYCVKSRDAIHCMTKVPGSPGQFEKRLYTLVDSYGELASSFAVLCYRWTGTPFDIPMRCHGNAKSTRARSKPFIPTPPSAMRTIKEAAQELDPLNAKRYLESKGIAIRGVKQLQNHRWHELKRNHKRVFNSALSKEEIQQEVQAAAESLSSATSTNFGPITPSSSTAIKTRYSIKGAGSRDYSFSSRKSQDTPGSSVASAWPLSIPMDQEFLAAKKKKLEQQTKNLELEYEVLTMKREEMQYRIQMVRCDYANHPASKDETQID